MAVNKTAEQFIPIANSDHHQIITGAGGEHKSKLEGVLNLEIDIQSKGLILKGDKTDLVLAVDFLEQFQELLDDNDLLSFRDLERAFKLVSGDRNIDLKDTFQNKIKIRGKKSSFFPKTPNQKTYIDAIKNHDIVFGVGPAGTGKTYLAMAMAVNALLEKKVKKIVLSRPAVEAGEKLGFLPGDLNEKVDPYLRPLYDALYELTSVEKGTELIAKGAIEVAPLAFMRGRTFNDAFVILDEAQNCTPPQMKMFLTRMGFNSKCLITGDISQIDLPTNAGSGLIQAIKVLKNVSGIAIVHLTDGDVVRHPLVAAVVRAYDKYENSNA